jgi:hypothetical protein
MGHYSGLTLKEKNEMEGLTKHFDHTGTGLCFLRLSSPTRKNENPSRRKAVPFIKFFLAERKGPEQFSLS